MKKKTQRARIRESRKQNEVLKKQQEREKKKTGKIELEK